MLPGKIAKIEIHCLSTKFTIILIMLPCMVPGKIAELNRRWFENIFSPKWTSDDFCLLKVIEAETTGRIFRRIEQIKNSNKRVFTYVNHLLCIFVSDMQKRVPHFQKPEEYFIHITTDRVTIEKIRKRCESGSHIVSSPISQSSFFEDTVLGRFSYLYSKVRREYSKLP